MATIIGSPACKVIEDRIWEPHYLGPTDNRTAHNLTPLKRERGLLDSSKRGSHVRGEPGAASRSLLFVCLGRLFELEDHFEAEIPH
jgi:hypothetical protein